MSTMWRCIDCGEPIVQQEKKTAHACSDCLGLMHAECGMRDVRGILRCEKHHDKPPGASLWEKTVGEA